MEDAPDQNAQATAPKRTRPGPASELTPELVDAIAERIAKGLPKRQTCALLGLSDSLLGKWLERGREAQRKGEENLQVELVRAVEWAEARYMEKQLGLLHKAATSRKVDYRPVMGVLSRRFPKEYGTPTAGAPGAAQDGEPGSEVLKPEEIEAALAEKLQRFLNLHEKKASEAAPAAPSEEPPRE